MSKFEQEHLPLNGIGTHEPKWDILGSNELEPLEKDRLYTFRSALNEAFTQPAQVIELEDRLHNITNPTKPVNSQLIEAVKRRIQRHGGNFWLSPEYAWVQGAGLNNFSVLRSGRAETSAHQVFFGLLHDGNTEGKTLAVAVKPCTTKPITACHDWLNAELAGRGGERRFNPVAFIVGPKAGYSLTELEPNAETLDTSNWEQALLNVHDPEYEGQRTVLNGIAKALAGLHRKDIYHGDPQFKNIALDITGSIFFIDWESAAFYGDKPEMHVVIHKAAHDLKVLFASMARSERDNGVGLLHHFAPKDQWRIFKRFIFDPYIQIYLENVDENSAKFEQAAEVEQEIKSAIIEGQIQASFKRARSAATHKG